MGVGQLSESDAVDALRLPFYSSSHPQGHMVGGISLIWAIPIELLVLDMGRGDRRRRQVKRNLGTGKDYQTPASK